MGTGYAAMENSGRRGGGQNLSLLGYNPEAQLGSGILVIRENGVEGGFHCFLYGQELQTAQTSQNHASLQEDVRFASFIPNALFRSKTSSFKPLGQRLPAAP